MPVRQRTLGLAVDYIDRHFSRRFLFPIAAGKKFPPCIKNNLADASNDPEQLRAWEAQWPGCNWGLSLAKSEIMAADIDVNPKKNKVGQLTYDVLDLENVWPDTETTYTPSGGFHKIYEGWSNDDHPAHIMALGDNGIGKDIDSPNYVLIPGCTFDDGTSYTVNDLEAVKCPEWIYDQIKSSKTKSRITNAGEVVVELDQQANIDIATDYLKNDAEPSIQGNSGDYNLLKAAYYLKDFGISQGLGAELLNEYFNPRCVPPWEMADFEKKMAGAYAYANLSKVGGKTAQAEFADVVETPIVQMGKWDPVTKTNKLNRLAIKREIRARAGARVRDEIIARGGTMPPPDPDAKTVAAICNRWMWIIGMKRWIDRVDPIGARERDIWDVKSFDSKYNRVVAPKTGSASDKLFRMKKGGAVQFPIIAFKPGQLEIAENGQAYNMYRQPNVPRDEPGDTSWWDAHLEYLFPDEAYRNHLLNWMAWLVQNLAKKPKHALIIQGEVNGTGKSFIGKVLARILHEANVSIVPQNGLSGRFNSWAMACKLIVIEELRASDKRAVKEALHDIITEDRINIEKKGVDSFMIDSCFGVMAFTNDDAALDLDNTDRRYLVIRTDRTKAEADTKEAEGYFIRLFAKLDDPAAMAAVAYSLVNRDLKGYSGQQAAPMTEAKGAMKKAAMSELEYHLDATRDAWPLCARLVSVEDVITSLPKRLERSFRLQHTIKKFLLTELGGVELGQCRTPKGERPRLYAINGSAAILAGQPRIVAGKLYEEALKEKKDVSLLEEFDDTDDDDKGLQ